MGRIGGNGFCPCGSGRRRSECCGHGGGRDRRSAAAAARQVRESALSKLMTFAYQPVFDADHSVAELVFWGDLMRSAAAGDLQRLLDSGDATVKYNAWFLFDWQIDSAMTPVDLFLSEPAVTLTEEERRCLERLSRAHLRLYETEAVELGGSVRLRDLWTDERLFVLQGTATEAIVTWDLLGARVATDDSGRHIFEGGVYQYPSDARQQVLGRLRRAYRRYQRTSPAADLPAFFRRHGMLFHHLWLELVAFPEPPHVTTSEGDPLMFCQAVFDTEHVEEIRSLISAHADVRAAEESKFAWYDRSSGESRELGRWMLEGQRVVFETSSQARAVRGRAWLEALAGDRVRYRATAMETLEQTMTELRRPSAAPDRPSSPPSDVAAVRELFDRHYRQWLDRPDPALGNRTPRSAARSRTWRPRLVEQLKRSQNSVERAALAGRPRYDFGWVWKELGLDGAEQG